MSARPEQIIAEIISTEATFCQNMKIARDAWEKYYLLNKRLRLSEQQKRLILTGLNEAYMVSKRFLEAVEKLKKMIPTPVSMHALVKFVNEYESIYQKQIKDYANALAKVALLNTSEITNAIADFEKDLKKKSPKNFEAVQQALAGKPRFSDYLIQSVQRIPRHELLARELSKEIPNAGTQLVKLANQGALAVNESVRQKKVQVICHNFSDKISTYLNDILEEVKQNAKLQTELNFSPLEIQRLQTDIRALSYQGNNLEALAHKKDCLSKVVVACAAIMQKIEQKIDEEPNLFKKLLINIGVLNYKEHQRKKHKQLLGHYNNIKTEFEQLQHSANPEDIAFMKEYNAVATAKKSTRVPKEEKILAVKGVHPFLLSNKEKLNSHEKQHSAGKDRSKSKSILDQKTDDLPRPRNN